jgi:hypothetical protein
MCITGAIFCLLQYIGIATALRTGNIQLYREEMAKFRVHFMRIGVFLLLEKLQPLIMRRLFKRMYGGLRVCLRCSALHLTHAFLPVFTPY